MKLIKKTYKWIFFTERKNDLLAILNAQEHRLDLMSKDYSRTKQRLNIADRIIRVLKMKR